MRDDGLTINVDGSQYDAVDSCNGGEEQGCRQTGVPQPLFLSG
jgi:hypothetical protein